MLRVELIRDLATEPQKRELFARRSPFGLAAKIVFPFALRGPAVVIVFEAGQG